MSDSASLRILICRLSAVGDCILTMPVLCALRHQFPRAFLGWVVEAGAAPLLRDHPCLDQLLVVPKGWLKSPRAVADLSRQLRAAAFDVALDPQSLTKSSLVARLSGARQRIGFCSPRGRELSLWLNNCQVRPTRPHLVDAQLQLLEPLGVDNPRVQFAVPRDEAAETRMAAALQTLHLGCPFVVMNVGAGWDSRLWPAARYGRVAKYLGQRHGLPSLVVWAGPRELGWAEEVLAASGGQALVAPPTSLPELAAILRRARLFIGSDTGPMHLAAAVGTPCVGLFGTTRPEDSGPYGSQHACVQHRYQGGSSRARRRAANAAMCEITPEMVYEACETVLRQKDARHHAA